MAHIELTRANTVRDHYAWQLAASYSGYRIYDPDYATLSDREAWDKVQRDAKIQSLIDRRRLGTALSEFQVLPASDNDDDKGAAELMQRMVDEVFDFHGSLYQAAAAVFRGDDWQFINGVRKDIKVPDLGRIEAWVPTQLHHMDRYRFRQVRPRDADRELKIIWQWFSLSSLWTNAEPWQELKNPEWFVRTVFNRNERSKHYGQGLLGSMYYSWRAKEVALSRGIDGLERWAQGLLKIGMDGSIAGDTDKTNEDVAQEWVTVMKKHLAEHVLVHDKNDEVDVLDGPQQGHEVVTDMVNYFDNCLSSLILQSVLPTGGGEDVGSLARAEEEGDQMDAVIAFDRRTIADSYTKGLIGLTWKLNRHIFRTLYPDASMPSFSAESQRSPDPMEALQGAEIASRLKVPLKQSEVYEVLSQLGFSQPAEGDTVFDWEDLQEAAESGDPFGFLRAKAADNGVELPSRT